MHRVAVIVQARFGSTRLPGKVLKKLGSQSVLTHVLERCQAVPGASVVCCAVPTTADSDPVAEEAKRAGAFVYRGSEEDVLARYHGAALAVRADVILRVTSDCPLIDPEICGQVLQLREHHQASYACNNMPMSWPHGLDCEAFPFDWLDRAFREATDRFHREHVAPFIRNHPEAVTANLACPIRGLTDHRWTLDTPTDWTFFQALWPYLPEGRAGWSYREPLSIVGRFPEIAGINAMPRDPREWPRPMNGQDIALRPASLADRETLFTWQQDPKTRRYFRDPNPPTRETHNAWFDGHIADEKCLFRIILRGEEPVGVLRLDRESDGSYEVSILVAPSHQGRGIAREALVLGRELRPAACLTADVHPDNLPSQALFLGAGFVQEQPRRFVLRPGHGLPVVALFPDSAPDAGLGHLMRCLGLADALVDAGLHPLFMLAPESPLAEAVTARNFEVSRCAATPKTVVDASEGAAVLVVDHYRLDLAEIAALLRNRADLVVFDDTCRNGLVGDVIINGSPAAASLGYEHDGRATYLTGPTYQIIRPDLRPRTIDWNAPPRRVLVTIGGTDPLGISDQLLDIVHSMVVSRAGVEADFVVGPMATVQQRKLSRKVHLVRPRTNMADMLSTADVALCGGGQTVFELVACGVPTLALGLADNQVSNLEALASLGCISYAGLASSQGWQARVAAGLSELLADPDVRKRLSARTRGVFDHRGGERIARVIADRVGTSRRTE